MICKMKLYNDGKGIEWPYLCRSYKVLKLLTDDNNFKIINRIIPEITYMICNDYY